MNGSFIRFPVRSDKEFVRLKIVGVTVREDVLYVQVPAEAVSHERGVRFVHGTNGAETVVQAQF